MTRVAVDFGTSSTCVVVAVWGREPQVVAVDGVPLMSSAVYAAADGTLFVGQEADRQAALDPSRYEPHPKRRIDEGQLLLGSSVLEVPEVIRAVLRRAVGEARRVAGGAEVGELVLTHPADWGGTRTKVLRQAAGGLAARTVLVPEPVAAAVFHATTFPARRSALAVLDVGGGTVDVSVVRASPGGPGYEVLATRGDPTFGGADVDQLLLDHVGSVVAATDADAWRTLAEGRELPDRRRRRVIHQDVRGAKETLSRHTYTDVPMPPPFPDVHVTRGDLERLITPAIERAADLTATTIADAGLRPTDLAGIFLVGGSSRIPLVSHLVHKRCGVVPTTLDQPETVVARGALMAVPTERPDPGTRATTSAPPGVNGTAGSPPGTAGNGFGAGGSAPGAAGVGFGAVGGSPGTAGRGFDAGGSPGTAGSGFGAGAPGGAGVGSGAGGGPAGAAGGGFGAAGSSPAVTGVPRAAGGGALSTGGGGVATPSGGVPVAGAPLVPVPRTSQQRRTDGAPPRPGAVLPPPPAPPASRRTQLLVVAGAAALVAAVASVVVLVLGDGAENRPRGNPAPTTTTEPSRLIAQYEYRFALPDGWLQTGGDPAKLRTEVKPADRQDGDDVVFVEQIRLAFDSTADRDRAVDKLRTDFEAAGPAFSAFDADASFAGRDVIHYRQALPNKDATVDWYVFFEGRTQVSIGCQHENGGDRTEAVAAACETIVRTVTITG